MISVFDVRSVLPSYGESDYICTIEKGSIVFDIIYDSPKKDDDFAKLRIRFNSFVFFNISSFPGVSLIDKSYNTDFLGELVEFKESHFKKQWEKHFENKRSLKHYNLLLLSSNKQLDIICKDVEINN